MPKKKTTKKTKPSSSPRKAVKAVKPPRQTKKKSSLKTATGGYLSQVVNHADAKPWALVVHGVGGVGKTSLAAAADNPLFLIDSRETGVFDLMRHKRIDEVNVMPIPESFRETNDMLIEASRDAYDLGFRTLVVDSLTGMEQLCFVEHCEEEFGGDWSQKGFLSFQQGPRNAAKTVWPEFLSNLDCVRAGGLNVLLIAHSQIATFSNPDGPNYDRWVPNLNKETWAITYQWAEVVLYANFEVNVEQEDKRKAKPTGDAMRLLNCEWSPTYDAKNRWGLPSYLEMGESGETAFAAIKKYMV